MKFIADLHVHSKYSRATAKDLDLEHLYIAAQLKGITVVGTGDFTHPGWFSEIREKLVPAEPGLFELNPQIAAHCDEEIPATCRGAVRFMLVSEISNIYKKNERTRKNHNLVFVPDLEKAEKFNERLDQIGNIKSDGRPILGLDARNLLEILLETAENGFLIPAHIWTPWFSVLGSKSGFDSIGDCFEDLTPHIFAVETGLSSDPPMNWRVSGLDKFTLVSNSDAHSPLKLGREANIFATELSYDGIRRALETGDPDLFKGTFEFYPEEGKYHVDGHRKCNVRLEPRETQRNQGLCPVCGKPLTLGVLHRVEELADRNDGEKPAKTHGFHNLIPLDHLLSELLKVGEGSKKVKNNWRRLLETFGPEFHILHDLEPERLDSSGVPLLGEAVRKMRNNDVIFAPGYDGEFGKVTLFSTQEREQLLGQRSLFQLTGSEDTAIAAEGQPAMASVEKDATSQFVNEESPTVSGKKEDFQSDRKKERNIRLNEEQEAAVLHENGPLIIVAGPGTGKTRTITHRICHLIREKGVDPGQVLAVTFTNQAAREMKERLATMLETDGMLPHVATFHALCLDMLREDDLDAPLNVTDESDRRRLLEDAVSLVKSKGIAISDAPDIFEKIIVMAKQQILGPNDETLRAHVNGVDFNVFSKVYAAYQQILQLQGLCDFEDLIFRVVKNLESRQQYREFYRNRFTHIFVDEYQDLNHGQYRIIKALSPPDKDICVIGDPDQSIYGFRGSDLSYFRRFLEDFPASRTITLNRNYRSSETILASSHQVIRDHQITIKGCENIRTYSRIQGEPVIRIMELPTDRAEAVAIGKVIEQTVGGTGFYAVDFGKVDSTETFHRTFSDFAILYRTHLQGQLISDILEKAGMPCQIASREHILRQKAVQELVSLLKIVLGQGSFPDFQRIAGNFKPAPGKKILDVFKNWAYAKSLSFSRAVDKATRVPIPEMSMAAQQRLFSLFNQISELRKITDGMDVRGMLVYLTENTGLLPQFNNNGAVAHALETLLDIAGKYEGAPHHFPSGLNLHVDTDIYDPSVEKVSLMTMHAAKGLEFPVVFIAGCESDYIPFRRNDSAPMDVAEERRLFYVAMTRAKQQLYFTSAKTRKIYGKKTPRERSPFVADIEAHLLAYEANQLKKSRKGSQRQLNLFD